MYLLRTLPPNEFMAHWRSLKDHVRFPGDFSGSARFREELRLLVATAALYHDEYDHEALAKEAAAHHWALDEWLMAYQTLVLNELWEGGEADADTWHGDALCPIW